MKKTVIIVIGLAIAAVVVPIYMVIHAVMAFFGYLTPLERKQYKQKTKAALEKRYPEHDFHVETVFGSGEYGYYLNIHATDENGIEFRVQWVEGEMEDHYHDEWNEFYYGQKLVEYQNGLRDKYFPQIPYVDTYEHDTSDLYEFARGPYQEVFFASMDEAVEGSKCGRFATKVTFQGIDLETADDAELEHFAASIAESMVWLYEQTGYDDIRINSIHYHEYDESGSGYKTKEDFADSVVKQIKFDREHDQIELSAGKAKNGG